MGYRFQAQQAPAEALCSQVAALSPANPFYTPGFVAARCAGGAQAWILILRDNETIVTGCTAFMMSGRLNRTLEIQSLPRIPDSEFWNGLEKFCRERRITELFVNSFGSETASIPRLKTETGRTLRREYVLNLAHGKVLGKLSSNHKRNIANARKLGIVVRVAADFETCAQHAQLMDASMNRRLARGEAVFGMTDVQNIWRFVKSGAGAIHQALEGTTVLSSVLVLAAQRGAYYHSAGTSPDGMAKGASHLLIYHIAGSLAQQGLERFNLGGADEGGLVRFKTGFGAGVVELEAASFYFGNPLKKKIREAFRRLRDNLNHRLNSRR